MSAAINPLPYLTIIRHQPDGTYVVTAAELPGCITEGPTPEDALGQFRFAVAVWLGEPAPCQPQPLSLDGLLQAAGYVNGEF